MHHVQGGAVRSLHAMIQYLLRLLLPIRGLHVVPMRRHLVAPCLCLGAPPLGGRRLWTVHIGRLLHLPPTHPLQSIMDSFELRITKYTTKNGEQS